MPRRLAALPVVLVALAHAAVARAAAGGGTSGFGGGGGSSGGSSFSGGSGGSTTAVSGAGTLIIVLLVVVFFVASAILAFVAERRRRRWRDARARLVRAAAAEAAEDDAAFHADAVEREARRIFTHVQAAWSERDVDALARLCGEDLLVEWRRRLRDFERKGWRNRVEILSGPEVHYVGLVNRERDEDDRVVVLVEARLEDDVVDRGGRRITRKGDSDAKVSLREYWTLGKRDGRWILVSIEQLREGEHHLEAPIVASPWSDGRLRDDALVETAAADAAPDDADIATLVSLDLADDARAAALDLSLVDGRFAPDVLEAAARRAIEAWAEAVDGRDDALHAVAGPDVARELLHPRGQGTRLVVRGPRLRRMTLVRLDGDARSPAMEVERRCCRSSCRRRRRPRCTGRRPRRGRRRPGSARSGSTPRRRAAAASGSRHPRSAAPLRHCRAYAYRFDDEVRQVERDGHDPIVIDLSGIAFIDSSGLARLVAARRRARRAGRRLVLVRGPDVVQRLFAIVALEEQFEFAPSCAAALAARRLG